MTERSQSRVARAILDYLRKHPEAQDTIDGVAEWWLPEQGIRNRTASVQEALNELVAEGLLSEHQGTDAQISYRLTRRGLRKPEDTLTE